MKLRQDSHLSVFVGGQTLLEGTEGLSSALVRIAEPPFQVTAYLRKLASLSHHMNYPMYPTYREEQLIHVPRRYGRPDRRFFAFLNARWVFETRLGSDKIQLDAMIRNLEILQILQNPPGLAPFLGVVVDASDTITAFLREIPAKGKLFNILRDAKPLSWDQCERWCAQIVQGIAQVHRTGYGVGFLWHLPCCGIGIDAYNNAVLYKDFQFTFQYDASVETSCVPPEYRHLAPTRGSLPASPQTDIFHLGMLLWRIVQTASSFGCSKLFEDIPRGQAQLPQLNKDVPQYMRDMIACCRSENPEERPAAWQLLAMFPVNSEVDAVMSLCTDINMATEANHGQEPPLQCDNPTSFPGHQTSRESRLQSDNLPVYLTRLEDCLAMHGLVITCDICRECTTEHYFECEICAIGDYDICPSCFSKGCHCLEPQHKLREHFRGRISEERYYSSVAETGKRHVLVR